MLQDPSIVVNFQSLTPTTKPATFTFKTASSGDLCNHSLSSLSFHLVSNPIINIVYPEEFKITMGLFIEIWFKTLIPYPDNTEGSINNPRKKTSFGESC